ncbi:MAG TPA: thioredoxin family protein, partial [Firmicutes bacterium]|nr:thioredoxin family protein [Bacillota bacterium]
MKEILILGPGCYRCEKLEKDVKEVAEEMGVEYEIFKVSDVKA